MNDLQVDWILEKKPISEVIPNETNPRRLSKKQAQELERSIGKFGLCQPIVVNYDGSIIGGHQRLQTLQRLGYSYVVVYRASKPLSPQEEKELSIRLNKNIGDWDFDLLANHWEPEELLEWGFTMDELCLESLPGKEHEATKFTINISCTDQDQLEIIEKQIKNIINDFTGAKYKVKVK